MRVVFPELPVIAIIFALVKFLFTLAKELRKLRALFTLIVFFFIPIFFVITAETAPLRKALCINVCPSFFFPLIATNRSPFLTFLESILI